MYSHTGSSTYASSATFTDRHSTGELLRRLRRAKQVAYLMDSAFRLPGTNYRIGLDSLVGLIPGAGDLATAAVSGYIVFQAIEMGASASTIARMMINVAIDTLVGAVPIAGDLFDAAFKANRKNIELLERSLHLVPETGTRKYG